MYNKSSDNGGRPHSPAMRGIVDAGADLLKTMYDVRFSSQILHQENLIQKLAFLQHTLSQFELQDLQFLMLKLVLMKLVITDKKLINHLEKLTLLVLLILLSVKMLLLT